MDKLLQNNAVLRVIALILACILWLAVNSPGNGSSPINAGVTEKFPYPVHVEVASDMVVTEIDNPTAVIEVSGDTVNVTSLPAQMLSVQVVADARNLTPGKHVLRLSAINMPPVNYSLDPSTVTVMIDKKVSESKEVIANVNGKPAVGYGMGTAQTDISTVTVSGVKAAVDSVDRVEADLSINGSSQTVTKVVNLRPVDKNGHVVAGVDLNPTTATVTVPIQPPEVVASVVAQIVGTPAPGYAVAGVNLNSSTVVVHGDPTATNGLQTINAPIDVTGFRSTKTVQVQLPLRQGITKLDPGTIQATVKIEASATRTFTNVPIVVQNSASSEHVTVSGAQTVTVTVNGPKSIVDGMTDKDVTVYIDAAHLKDGDQSVPVNVALPDWTTVGQLSPNTTTVHVTGAPGGGQ